MSSSFISISALTKHFQMGGTTVRALDGVELDIPRKSFTVVMGPSGSGKSTLLYLLGGLDRPTSGQILVNNQRLDEMDENRLALFRRKTVGFIFQRNGHAVRRNSWNRWDWQIVAGTGQVNSPAGSNSEWRRPGPW